VEDPGIRLWREVARQSLRDFELTKRGRESSAVPSSRVSNSSADPNSRYSGSFVRDWSPATSVSIYANVSGPGGLRSLSGAFSASHKPKHG
jgi:hypothetical protein